MSTPAADTAAYFFSQLHTGENIFGIFGVARQYLEGYGATPETVKEVLAQARATHSYDDAIRVLAEGIAATLHRQAQA